MSIATPTSIDAPQQVMAQILRVPCNRSGSRITIKAKALGQVPDVDLEAKMNEDDSLLAYVCPPHGHSPTIIRSTDLSLAQRLMSQGLKVLCIEAGGSISISGRDLMECPDGDLHATMEGEDLVIRYDLLPPQHLN